MIFPVEDRLPAQRVAGSFRARFNNEIAQDYSNRVSSLEKWKITTQDTGLEQDRNGEVIQNTISESYGPNPVTEILSKSR